MNPLLNTSDDKIMAVDAKINLDENSLFRYPEKDPLEEGPF